MSKTSHIPSTEQYGHAFTLRYTEDGPTLDSFVNVSAVLRAGVLAIAAAHKLTGEMSPEFRGTAEALWAMTLRARLNADCHGLYLVKTDFQLTLEELEQVLRAMGVARRKAFLKEAEI